MQKEEILNQEIKSADWSSENGVVDYDCAISAMDEWAKIDSIRFAEWIITKVHKIDTSDKWYPKSGLQYPSYTIEQLYDMYEGWKIKQSLLNK